MNAPSPRTYFGYTLWSVLDDETGELDYWDIHDPDDPRGEGDPLAEGFTTLTEAQEWVRHDLCEKRVIALLGG